MLHASFLHSDDFIEIINAKLGRSNCHLASLLKQLFPGIFDAVILDLGGKIGEAGDLECSLDVLGVTRALQTGIVDGDGRLCFSLSVSLCVSNLLIDTIKYRLLPIYIVLAVEAYIDLFCY